MEGGKEMKKYKKELHSCRVIISDIRENFAHIFIADKLGSMGKINYNDIDVIIKTLKKAKKDMKALNNLQTQEAENG